ncbi:hypothetical protein PENTCL1PPCAC_13859, partial [Pristionchus entomophagus]
SLSVARKVASRPYPAHMTGGEQELRCLICQVPITQCHLGIDSCRACAVFYKRTLNLKRPLKCKEGDNFCLQEDPTSSCRQCRFVRFKEVFDRACAGEQPEWLQKEDLKDSLSDLDGSSETEPVEELKPSFIDHNSYFDCAPSCRDTPILDNIKKAYSMMCLVRKSAEIGAVQRGVMHAVLTDKTTFLLPAKYSTVVSFSHIFFSAALDFARASFDDLSNLSAENRHFIVFRNFKLIMSLDGAYRANQHFPDDEAVMASYSTFINDDTMQDFFEDCPFDINKKNVAEEFKKNIRRTSVANKGHFKRVKLSSDEFAALLGLAVWNDNSLTRSDLLPLVSSNRTAIMKELHKLYAKQGMADYAARLGELLCLLVNVERVLDLTNEDIQVYRMMNLFNEAFEDVR